jgi:hypothetical protein
MAFLFHIDECSSPTMEKCRARRPNSAAQVGIFDARLGPLLAVSNSKKRPLVTAEHPEPAGPFPANVGPTGNRLLRAAMSGEQP